jgi:transcriptional regulator with XRE-family HTH domain
MILMHPASRPVGDLLREWRQRRRLSQLALALDADISTKHLSFLETGRSRPSREMLLHLAELLGIPLRERNALLQAGGFAAVYPQHALSDPPMQAARIAVEAVLAAHDPYPALAVDRHWTLVAANQATQRLLAASVSPALLAPPVNVLRASLHPEGLARAIANLPAWRGHILARLRQQIAATADPVLIELAAELAAYPGGVEHPAPGDAGLVLPLRLRHGDTILSLFGTVTVFGTPVDITLAELAIEAFYPADAATEAALRALPSPEDQSGSGGPHRLIE